MPDGTYFFRGCVPDADVTFAGVTQGQVLQRPYSFRANLPPEIQSELDSGAFAPENLLTGSDGELFDGDGNFLAEVNEWEFRVTFANIDYSPAGERINWAIPDRYSCIVTLTETQVRDAALLSKVVGTGLRKGQARPVLTFRGVLRAPA